MIGRFRQIRKRMSTQGGTLPVSDRANTQEGRPTPIGFAVSPDLGGANTRGRQYSTWTELSGRYYGGSQLGEHRLATPLVLPTRTMDRDRPRWERANKMKRVR